MKSKSKTTLISSKNTKSKELVNFIYKNKNKAKKDLGISNNLRIDNYTINNKNGYIYGIR